MAIQIKEVDFLADDFIEIDGKFYVDQKAFDDACAVAVDISRKGFIMYGKLESLGIDVEQLIADELKKLEEDE